MIPSRRKTGTVVVAVVGAALLALGSTASTQEQPVEKEKPKAAAPAPKPPSALDVWQAYENNDAAGDERFLGKRLRLAGDLVAVKTAAPAPDRPRAYVLVMRCHDGGDGAPGQPPKPRDIRFAFEFGAGDRKELAALVPGRGVIVEGVCGGRTTASGDLITFTDCKIVVLPPP